MLCVVLRVMKKWMTSVGIYWMTYLERYNICVHKYKPFKINFIVEIWDICQPLTKVE